MSAVALEVLLEVLINWAVGLAQSSDLLLENNLFIIFPGICIQQLTCTGDTVNGDRIGSSFFYSLGKPNREE